MANATVKKELSNNYKNKARTCVQALLPSLGSNQGPHD